MRYAHLGRSGMLVSRLCLGTQNLGSLTDERESFAILDRGLEHGINVVDTADVYGDVAGSRGGGATEMLIGRWLTQGGGRREKLVLATKVYQPMSDWPNDGRLSARHIRQACEGSLRRLRTDYIDLYQMHHVDRETPWEEIWEAFEVLRYQGKILYVGSSNFAGWHIAQANEQARARGLLGLISEQSLYNLTARTLELEVLPACAAYGVGVLTWSPLARGLLAGAARADTRAGGRASTPEFGRIFERELAHGRARLEAWEAFCAELGEPPSAVALAWLLHQPAVVAPIVGPRTTSQLDALLRALEIELPEDALRRLDAIFPGPGGPAPEAYAW